MSKSPGFLFPLTMIKREHQMSILPTNQFTDLPPSCALDLPELIYLLFSVIFSSHLSLPKPWSHNTVYTPYSFLFLYLSILWKSCIVFSVIHSWSLQKFLTSATSFPLFNLLCLANENLALSQRLCVPGKPIRWLHAFTPTTFLLLDVELV